MARVVLRLVALLTVVTGGPLVVLAGAEAIVRHNASVTPEDPADAFKTDPVPLAIALAPGPLPQFVGRPKSRDGSRVVFNVDEMELGEWAGTDPVVLRGVALVPWRRYRVVLLPGEAGEPRLAADVETLDVAGVPGIKSLGVLPLYDLLAMIGAPLVIAAAVFLVVSSRHQGHAEEDGIVIRGLRRRPRARRAPRRSTRVAPE